MLNMTLFYICFNFNFKESCEKDLPFFLWKTTSFYSLYLEETLIISLTMKTPLKLGFGTCLFLWIAMKKTLKLGF